LSQNYFADVDLFQTTKDGALMNRHIAKKATLGDGYWHLSDVVSWDMQKGEGKHDTINVPTQFSIKKILESNAKPETISFWDLSAFIDNLKKSGLSDVRYNLHWHVQLSKIGQALALILLAAAFCLHPTRYKKASTLIFFGLITGFMIHFKTDIVHAINLGSKIPIIVGAWAPVFITFLLSMGLIIHTEQAH
ncbi:MAG: LptF/LptG family permease, partial [Alphaproteobacteria bacterium]|nr:LptF/LptG family permease [Alphaproteobacteria bacterium]